MVFGVKRAFMLLGCLLALWLTAWGLKTLTSESGPGLPKGRVHVPVEQIQLAHPSIESSERTSTFSARAINQSEVQVLALSFRWVLEDCQEEACVIVFDERFRVRAVIPPGQARELEKIIGIRPPENLDLATLKETIQVDAVEAQTDSPRGSVQ